MITEVKAQKALELLERGSRDIFAVKIAALIRAYGTDYPFCKAYAGRGIVLCKYYGDIIITRHGSLEDGDYDELAGFLSASGFSQILCGVKTAQKLNMRLRCKISYGCLYRYVGGQTELPGNLEINPPLDKVFEVLKSSFDLRYEDWYADASHGIRHGINRIYLLDGGATVTVTDSIFGISYGSHVCTHPDFRGKGLAAKLLGYVGGETAKSGSVLFIICKKELEEFYRRAGFTRAGGTASLSK